MLQWVPNPPKENKYGRFFLSEAPGDPDDNIYTTPSETYTPADNTRVINIMPASRRLNFEPSPLEAEDEQPTQEQPPEPDTNIGVDPNTQPPPTDPNVGGDSNANMDPNGTPDTPDVGNTGERINFGADGGDQGDPNVQTQPESPENSNQSGHGIEVDSTRRYILFKDFMALFNAIDRYTEKLQYIISDDYENNEVINQAVNNLKDIQKLTHDYMLLKFEANTYAQSLFFYQFMITTTQRILLNLHESRKKILKNKDKEP